MSTLGKVVHSLLGGARPRPVTSRATEPPRTLPPPLLAGGLPVMEAIARRRSQREFTREPILPQELSDLLWAAGGINRPQSHGRTAPSALDAREVDLYVALDDGLYVYDPEAHAISLVAREDARNVTGYQDFVDQAPLDLVYVANHEHMRRVPVKQRAVFSAIAAGAMVENVYLYCASAGLATVVRAWFDAESLAKALRLGEHETVIIAQTVGRPAIPA